MGWGFCYHLETVGGFNLPFGCLQLQPSDCDLASIFIVRGEKQSLLKSVALNVKQIPELS